MAKKKSAAKIIIPTTGQKMIKATIESMAKAYAFLSLWIPADFLVIFSHIYFAAWVIYFVLVEMWLPIAWQMS